MAENEISVDVIEQPHQGGQLALRDGGHLSNLFDVSKFEHIWRLSNVFAKSGLVPQQFFGRPENCLIAMQMAACLGIDPFMFMQGCYVINGRPGIDSKLAIALANTSGVFRGPIRYKLEGEGSKRKCTASATIRETGEEIEMTVDWAMVDGEGWNKKAGSKWLTMPDVMFRYRAAMMLIRTHCPEVIMGMQSREEIEDVVDVVSVDSPRRRTTSMGDDDAESFRLASDPEYAKQKDAERKAAAAAKQAERMRGRMSGGDGGAAAGAGVGAGGFTPTAAPTQTLPATNGHQPTTGAAENSNGTRHTNGTVATAASDRVDNENGSTTPPAGQEAANAESVKETAKATARTAKPKLATRAQLNEIRQLFTANEVSTEQQAAILEFYGVTEIAKLPIEKAAECIEQLKGPAGDAAEAAEQPASEPPFDADATTPTPSPASDVADIYKPAEEWAAKKDAAMQAAVAENGGLATAAQLQRINEIAERCGWDAAAQAEYLAGIGAAAFANLTVADADDLISELVRIELESAAGVVPPN